MKNLSTKLNVLKKTSPKKKTNIIRPSLLNKNTSAGELNPLLKAMVVQTTNAKTATANGAVTPASSGDRVLDFFSQAGALRGKSEVDVLETFKKAYYENTALAVKALFYIRDIRGGVGERKTFRTCLRWLSNTNAELAKANFGNIAFYGRFDDLFELFGTSVEKDMMIFANNQLYADLSAEKPSLAAKWYPSINASSKEGKEQGRKLAKFMGLSERNYRRILSHIRNKINLVETKLCSGDWTGIEYDKIPSRAGFVYRKAFVRHDKARYESFLGKVEKGEAKINTATLFPYDIVKNILQGRSDKTLEVAWENLPNYFEGKEPANRLVVVDTSSSMQSGMGSVRPLDISVSLGLYISERNTGPFKDWFITFDANPQLMQISGRNVTERISNLRSAPWGGNTNLQAVFDSILDFAKRGKVKEKDMPKELYIISDMQFDTACANNKLSNYETAKKKYKAAGYKMPKVIFWNVNASPNQSPVRMDELNTILVSGCSATILKNLLGDKNETPYDYMLSVLNGERYARILV